MDSSNKLKVIAFAGRAGSGKSFCADYVLEKSDRTCRIKFADGLKTMLAALYGGQGLTPYEIHNRIEGNLKEEPDPHLFNVSPRKAMQTLGDEWGRQCMGRAFWVKLWIDRVNKALNSGLQVVVDDVRYQNEVDAVRFLGGEVFMVRRPGSALPGSHSSEQMEFTPDHYIANDGSKAELEDTLDNLFHDRL